MWRRPESLRGSRYDPIERKNVPVLEFRQRKTLQVFLATPPWSLQAGETVPLVLEIKALNGISHVSWQGRYAGAEPDAAA